MRNTTQKTRKSYVTYVSNHTDVQYQQQAEDCIMQPGTVVGMYLAAPSFRPRLSKLEQWHAQYWAAASAPNRAESCTILHSSLGATLHSHFTFIQL
jgi:hypothetical protein